MWSISELKQNAKSLLKGYYWKGVIVCLIFGLITGSIGLRSTVTNKKSIEDLQSQLEEILEDNSKKYESDYDFDFDFETTALETPAIGAAAQAENVVNAEKLAVPADADYDLDAVMGVFFGVMVVVMVIAVAIGSLWAIFVINPLTVGRIRFFQESRYKETGITELFSPFTGGRYGNTTKVMFFYYIQILGWSLLFVIPGIIKTYEYFLVPYLVAENPDIDRKRAFEISRQCMEGEKMNCFVLGLSFIGWAILAALVPFGAGSALLGPYQTATFVEFFEVMKSKALSQNIAFPGEIITEEMRYSQPQNFGAQGGYNTYGGTQSYNSAQNFGGYSNNTSASQPFTGYSSTGGYTPTSAQQNNPLGGYTPAQSGYTPTQGGYTGTTPGGYTGTGAPVNNGTGMVSGTGYPSGVMDGIDTTGVGSVADNNAPQGGGMDSVSHEGPYTSGSFNDPVIGERNFLPDDTQENE